MLRISIIFGILIFIKNINASPGLIDVSHFKSNKIFSKPTKLGEALFYKYSCDDACIYTNVFDGDFKLFPMRSNTRLVNLVLAVKDDDIQLIQIMFSDIKNDYHINNLFYRRNEGSWELVDNLTYKTDLLTLKNNYISFDLNNPKNKGFIKHNLAKTHGYDSYFLKEGYELDKIYSGKNVVWDSEPYYKFESLDITESSQGPDRLRINYSNYFSEVNQYYKRRTGRWIFDVSQRQVDLLSLSTHGWKRKKHLEDKDEQLVNLGQEFDPDRLLWLDEYGDFEDKLVTFKVSDICDLEDYDSKERETRVYEEDNIDEKIDYKNKENKNSLDNLLFKMNFDKKDIHDLTVFRYESYDITSYEFVNLIGCRIDSIYGDNIPIFEFDKESKEIFHDIKLSYVQDHPVLAVALTTLKKVDNACDNVTNTCKESPFTYKTHYFKRINNKWFCLESKYYYSELNKMIEIGSTITMKKLYESPSETPTLIPSTPNLDYCGKEPFTYDINNPFEVKFNQSLIFTDPDLIKLQVKPEYVLNVIIDGEYILWEQKENGYGCLLIYIYRSDNELLSHLIIDSKLTDNHLFFRHNGKRWLPITKDDYEKSKQFYKGFKYIFKKPKPPIDEYILPSDLLEQNNNNKNNKLDPLSGLDLTTEALNYIKSASKSHV